MNSSIWKKPSPNIIQDTDSAQFQFPLEIGGGFLLFVWDFFAFYDIRGKGKGIRHACESNALGTQGWHITDQFPTSQGLPQNLEKLEEAIWWTMADSGVTIGGSMFSLFLVQVAKIKVYTPILAQMGSITLLQWCPNPSSACFLITHQPSKS